MLFATACFEKDLDPMRHAPAAGDTIGPCPCRFRFLRSQRSIGPVPLALPQESPTTYGL
jgi:hypothetical protein